MSISDRVLRARPASTALPAENPAKRRRILPENTTSSRTGTCKSAEEIEDLAVDKAARGVIGHFTDSAMQETLRCRTRRGKTNLQGAQESDGYHACHWSTHGNLLDNTFESVKNDIIKNGVTPTRAKPYLKAKNIHTPAQQLLHSKKGDSSFVEAFLKENISPQKRSSSLKDTHYGYERNATLGMPVLSNKFDSMKEAVMRPFEAELEIRRAIGEITPEQSTELFVEKLNEFYAASISANQERITQLKFYFAQEDVIEAFHSDEKGDFSNYLAAVRQLLECKKSLLTSSHGTSSCRDIKTRRNDYWLLEHLTKFAEKNTVEDTLDFYKTNIKPFLKPISSESRETFIHKYEHYIQEALFQQKGIAPFLQSQTINKLRKHIFGIGDQGVRRTPSKEEVSKQVFDMIKVISPPPKNTRREGAQLKRSKRELVY